MGGLAGTLASAGVSLYVDNLALHYYAVVNLLVTLALCWVFSFERQASQCSTPMGG